MTASEVKARRRLAEALSILDTIALSPEEAAIIRSVMHAAGVALDCPEVRPLVQAALCAEGC